MRKAVIVVGLGWGDEGKGSVVDALVRHEGASLVVRYNGGPQAAHHVVTEEGRVHCFSQFGSGALAGASTFLSRYMIVDPLALKREAVALTTLTGTDPRAKLLIDPDCPVVTPLHVALNKARETSRITRHGSCGRGVGELRAFALREPSLLLTVGELASEDTTYRKLRGYVDVMRDEWDTLGAQEFLKLPTTLGLYGYEPTAKGAAELLTFAYQRWWREFDGCVCWTTPPAVGVTVFEGAQGVLLDEWHGFHPHTTWATTTTAHAHEVIEQFGGAETRTVGVLRAYATRHGHGPFPTEGVVTPNISCDHNIASAWQGPLRVGAFDAVLSQYAVAATGGVDCVAITHLDAIQKPWPMAVAYDASVRHALVPTTWRDAAKLAWQEALGQALTRATVGYWDDTSDDFAAAVEHWLHVPVGIGSTGPLASDKAFLRAYAAHEVTT